MSYGNDLRRLAKQHPQFRVGLEAIAGKCDEEEAKIRRARERIHGAPWYARAWRWLVRR